ncbi:MAG: hypothetical protein GY839_04720, partial [candidate division Zixibacteria bacterium]|nr:hypothetical protein [candidate division Zixibacteria bacterium]
GNANNVSGVMIIDNEYGKVLTGTRTFGSIPAGGNAQSAGDYVVMVSPDCPDGYLLPFELTITADGTDEVMSVAEIMVNSPTLMVTGITIDDAGGNNNGLLDPGETANVILDVQNNGNEDAIELNGILDTGDAYLTITDIDGSFGDIPEGQARNNSGNPFTITADSDIFEGRKCQLMMTVSNSAGMSSEVPLTIEIGDISADDPVGPDDYGYYIYDNTDTDYPIAPTYDWVEIGSTGDRVARGDDVSDLVTIPFDFQYYGNSYRHLIISSNGFAALDTAVIDQGGNLWALFFNWPMPDPGGPGGMIAPFWDDLDGNSSGGKIVHEYDSENHLYVIQWDNVRGRWISGVYETFELIIYDHDYYPTVTGDCRISFQYEDITDSDNQENYSTVGFESFDEHDGLEYVFCRYYDDGAASLVDGRSLLITTNTGRGRVNGQATL